MSEITASLVKELRERTGAGIMDCKKALVETNGDIEAAIENMRKNGQAKAAKKAGRVAAEGVVLARITDDKTQGFVVELNCETDFVAKDQSFNEFAKKVADYVLANKVVDVEALKAHFEEERAHLVAKIGENISIRRLAHLEGTFIGGYTHGSKISVLVAVNANNEDVAKKLGMHVASSRPEYTKEEDIPADVLAKELEVQRGIANEDPAFAKKPENIQEQMINGRMAKFKASIALVSQPFVMDPAETVSQFLAKEGVAVERFIRVEVGEGIERKEENFADEVAKIGSSFSK
ncbi:translation elongation factor Ts [Psittacicella hinzii]|uniref:Elongation factor Ts n=1 Tax=Psittacicella hinzii TaxID=2028575 RepID=A0A3A1YF47_9GAMM|nr:translation elongation factor Ts [Psittacicella hinzii]RIY36181.1 translation elongation factor Ts [Psittacicella hinzii]